MRDSSAAIGFFRGFATAAIGLGILIGALWVVLWAVELGGGPDWRMPVTLLQSAGTLVLLGAVIRLLLQARPAKGAA